MNANQAEYEYSWNQQIENELKATKLTTRTNDQRKIFEQVQNKENWKLATNPVIVRSKAMAEKVSDAIIFFVGGAEVKEVCSNKFIVTSKGYYHYIGA